jgi:putative addiction module killer protein
MKAIKDRILRNYITPSGAVPFEEWISGLKDPVTRHRIKTRLDRVEKGNFGDHRSVGEGVLELRFDFGPGHRIYFVEEGDVIVILLCGGDKSSQVKDIKTAKIYWQELLERNHE